jgi:hypothetical protein
MGVCGHGVGVRGGGGGVGMNVRLRYFNVARNLKMLPMDLKPHFTECPHFAGCFSQVSLQLIGKGKKNKLK